MTDTKNVTAYMTADEYGILSATSKRLNISISMVIRHLVIYQGLCGGEMPLTSKILSLPPEKRSQALATVRKRAESNDPEIPQKWKQMVKEAAGSDDPVSQGNAADALLRKLLGE